MKASTRTPRVIRTQGRFVSREVNDGWYYEDTRGLTLIVELLDSSGYRRQLEVGRIPRRNVINAAKRYQAGRDEA